MGRSGTVLAMFVSLALTSPSGSAELDPETGLIKDEGWEIVKANCGACHSLRLVTAQRADRETWLDMIRWMQATQNLWRLPEELEEKIVGYLSKNYPPRPERRRAPIPPELMPGKP